MATVRRFAASVALLVVVISECRGQCDKYKRAQLLHASTTSIAIVTSPGYPNTDYPNDAQCSWQIVAEDPSLVIQLHINELQLDSDYANCRYDYVDLFDGNYYYNGLKHSTAILARLCSTKYGRNFYSTSPYMYVRFVTDPWDTAKGFSFGFRALPRSQVSTPAPGRATTPMYYKGDSTVVSIPTETQDEAAETIATLIAAIAGGFLGVVLVIAFLICVCLRCIKPCVRGSRPQCAAVPSASPPEEARQSGWRQSGDPVSFSDLVTEPGSNPSGRHRNDGHERARESRSRMEPPPGWNRRSGSPRSNPGGSQRHSMHLDVPERGQGSRSQDRSHRSRSPERGDGRGQGRRPRSDGGSGRPRSSGTHPPPLPSSPMGNADPPPSYAEVMAESIQPSAPPLPPEDR
ncbi:hypothetical protein ACOMHN_032953 [Nucella lapillus]